MPTPSVTAIEAMAKYNFIRALPPAKVHLNSTLTARSTSCCRIEKVNAFPR